MTRGVPYADALARAGRGDEAGMRDGLPGREALLSAFHPDYRPDAKVALAIGVSRGAASHPGLARLLQANALVDDVSLAGAPVVDCDVLVVGGGGAGCAAAMEAATQEAKSASADLLSPMSAQVPTPRRSPTPARGPPLVASLPRRRLPARLPHARPLPGRHVGDRVHARPERR